MAELMNSSSQVWWHIAVKAQVFLLSTENGGRSQPIFEKYRYSPNHKMSNGLFCMGSFKKIEGGEIKPGGNALVEITFVATKPFHEFFKEGLIWDIHEGSLKIGMGEILAILDKKEVPTHIARRVDQ